ncbi:MAG: ThuA domain-containing protein [Acidobacteria bacterium]|nr:ThuA domain-containing protein [Acidobacteriota bacterium]
MRRLWRLLSLGLFLAATLAGQPKRVLYVTHSAGYRHDVLPISIAVLRETARESGRIEIVATEDLAMLNAATLSSFDAVLLFTSGELPIAESQKQDLLNFVRAGKGFGGVHSATDTFYTWPEYGDLIGARFNGHPWVQQMTLDVEDPTHPATAHLPPGFAILDEIYQFREFSRDRVRVLLTLDAHSADMAAPGVNPGTEDFPLAWCRYFGEGRSFYTALGHFESTWRDPRFTKMLLEAMLWLTGQADGDATPRPPNRPSFVPDGIANSASFRPRMTISAGSLITLFGTNLTAGATFAADARRLPYKLAGTTVKLNGVMAPLLYASPSQINAYVPLDLEPRGCAGLPFCAGPHFDLELSAAGGGPSGTVGARLGAATATPGVFTVTTTREWATLWATGLGPVQPGGDLQVTTAQPVVEINGAAAKILFSGLAPGWVGLYQVNVQMPPGTTFPATLAFTFNGYRQLALLNPQP